MRSPVAVGCFLCFMFLGACKDEQRSSTPLAAETTAHPTLDEGPKSILRQLPDFEREQFEPTHYINFAETYQKVAAADRVAALNDLDRFARVPQNDKKMIVLCRMLFKVRTGSEFRPPLLGEPTFLGGTTRQDWPLEPIEVVDGVPFVIVRRYERTRSPESGEAYFRYCNTNCDWNDFHFEPRNKEAKTAALGKLKGSAKWKRPLTKDEEDFLDAQLR